MPNNIVDNYEQCSQSCFSYFKSDNFAVQVMSKTGLPKQVLGNRTFLALNVV